VTDRDPQYDDDQTQPQRAPIDDPDTGEDEPSEDEEMEPGVPPGFDPSALDVN
jgi:hypothetical protein